MKMKSIIRTAALLAAAAVATPAFAGGVTIAKDGDSKLKLEAKVFAAATSYKKETTTAGTTVVNNKSRSVSLDRAYLGIKYYFDDDWMMRITYDVNNETGLGKSQQVFLKYAYLEGKLAGKAAVLRLGQSHTPWIDYEQGLWKHRYVSKVTSDEYKYDSSSELGIGLKGKVDMFHYFVTATDGNSYSKAKNFKSNTGSTVIDLNARVGVTPVEGLTIDAQYITGYNGSKFLNSTVAVKQTFTQFMVTYGMGHDFRVGANYMTDKGTPDANSTKVKVKTNAFGLWGWANFTDNMGAFARYEQKTDKIAVTNAQKSKRYVAGFEYTPRKHVNLSLAIDSLKVSNLGSVANKSEKVTRVGLYSQFKF